MPEEKEVKPEIKSDKLYEGELDYEKVRKNPILQPILEINSLYENHGWMVQKATSDYEALMVEINEMLRLNNDYSSTMIVQKFQQILLAAKQTIHAQDLQRIFMKKAISDMIKINGKYFVPVEGFKGESEEKTIGFLDKIIQSKEPEIPKVEDKIDEKEKKKKKKETAEPIVWEQDEPQKT